MKKITSLLMALAISASVFAGCSKTAPSGGSTTPSPTGTAPAATTPAATKPAGGFTGEIKVGLVTGMTGTNKMVGEYMNNGFELAMEQINASGGILGKKLVKVLADEVDNMQAGVNATQKVLADPDVVAIVGSLYSVNNIAVSPAILEKKVIYFASGSSSGVGRENNPYIWQVRPTDQFQGKTLVKIATDILKMKNPAIMYSTQSSFLSLKDQSVAAFKAAGLNIPESNMYGFPDDEKNYAPIFTQIVNSKADGLIAMTNQMPAAIVMQQAEAAGVDLPLLGSTSYCSEVARKNSGSSSEGWYSVADWTPEVTTPGGKKFEDAYRAKYGTPSDLPSVSAYDALMVFKKACEIANSTTDKEAINNAIKKIKDFQGAMSTYSFLDDHCLSTSLFVTKNVGGKPTMIDQVKFR